MKKNIEVYLHGSKEYMYSLESDEELSLSDKAMSEFAYALYEVKLGIEVDTETGKVKILKVNGKELKE